LLQNIITYGTIIHNERLSDIGDRMKKVILLILSICILTLIQLNAKQADQKEWKWIQKKVVIEKSTGVINIDGNLNDPVWKRESLTGFTQNEPDEGKPATEKTEVWLAYDNNAIYIAARMHDSEPDKIISLLARRDDFVDADYFVVCFDPYYDKRSGFKFAVNPSGSIADWTIFNDGWDDNSWDGIWNVKTKIDNKGWTVEMRIPFDQLRFKKKSDGKYIWGVNFSRYIRRKNEVVTFSWKPKKVSGDVSHYAQLKGIKDIKPKRLFEVVPYTAGKFSFGGKEEGNPFKTGSELDGNSGLDLKFGLKSNLTLDLTVNPDFGQVEVDPAVINLTAAENYYREKRPFFIEGSSIFLFGIGGANNNIGADWGNPRFFYSRRIGRSPQGYVSTDGYVKYPEWTSILTAAKLSGKIGDGWNIGFLNAFTRREYAKVDKDGERSRTEVEPFSNYSVLRVHKEFNEGKQGVGLIATSVLRDMKNETLSLMLNKKAFSFGLDGWVFLDKKKMWVATGWLGTTEVRGNKERITDLQYSYPHYFQRPDADHVEVDENAISMKGWAGRFTLNKQEGNILFNAALGIISPGFDSRDMGFQWSDDVINAHIMTGYRSFKKSKLIHYWDIVLITQRNYDFGGTLIGDQRLIFIGDIRFSNFWSVNFQLSSNPERFDNKRTRGGPLMLLKKYTWFNFGIRSDRRKSVVVNAGGFRLLSTWGRAKQSFYTGFRWKPGSNFSLSINPRYETNLNNSQWVNSINDEVMEDTFGVRYLFGTLNQKTISCSIRLDWIFSPKLSLQAYIQPFISVGSYSGMKELAKPGTYNFNEYGIGNTSVSFENDLYTIDPGYGGKIFSISNPDFNYKSLRGTVVLRWEYRPGSILYLVWTQNRADYNNPGDYSFGRDFSNMIKAPGDNILMLKFTYRFTL